MSISKKSSVCNYCGVGCDITAEIENNEIKRIYADKDGYVSQGNLCVKGKYGFDFVSSDRRIRKPRIKKAFLERNPHIKSTISSTLSEYNDVWLETTYDGATTATAMKLKEIKDAHGAKSFCAIGGARTNCESAYLFQKFTRETMGSPHVDCCARVCHSPSLKGLRTTIGEGAATNPYNDIYTTEFILVIGSNTTEAHPIVANRIVEAAKTHNHLAVIDVRDIKLAKFAKYNAIIPYEANLLVLNMMARIIIDEELYDKTYIESRTKWFEEYKEKIISDPYSDPKFFEKLAGYEHLSKLIPKIAREYAVKKSMIFWGLGVTEHIDGSYAVMAIAHLALMTGNIGEHGCGLMPLRGQNNVQGACDMGCLPYYAPDYQPTHEDGLMTPQLFDAMNRCEIKALLNMGEDLLHIHPNTNKMRKAIKNLDLCVVLELFETEIAKEADILIGVKSGYEKTGINVNAMRRLHLSQPLVENDLLDDWEVIQLIDNKMGGGFRYEDSKALWDEARTVAHRRFSGASYLRLERHRKRGLQWPVYNEDTPVLHLLDFRTHDGLGEFHYHQYTLRGMIKELVSGGVDGGFYLTTGRVMPHYNNAAQTKRTPNLQKRYDEDVLLVSPEDAEAFPRERAILKTVHGESAPLLVKFSESIKPRTLFCTFHHAKSNINALFGDECDAEVMTAAFKSLKVEVVAYGEKGHPHINEDE